MIWRAGDSALGRWQPANTNQCGLPINLGRTFTFALEYTAAKGQPCSRNQANPIDAGGNMIYLTDSVQYTWTFHYIDGNPFVAGKGGMGRDRDARSLIWQIHGNIQPDSPCTMLMFTNGADDVTYGRQMWGFSTCNGTIWRGTYTPGEVDDWKIVATISKGSDGVTQLYRNGSLVVTDRGANYRNSRASPGDPNGYPWWNFGPYKWIWLRNPTSSSMSSVNMAIQDMTLTAE
jgi:hypothetical protein